MILGPWLGLAPGRPRPAPSVSPAVGMLSQKIVWGLRIYAPLYYKFYNNIYMKASELLACYFRALQR